MKVIYKLRMIVLGLGMMVCLGVCGAEYPVRVGVLNPRVLVDRGGAPFLLVGDSPHSLVVNLTLGDAAFYVADRGRNGFNSLWVELLCVPYTGGRADGSMLDGTLPFTGTVAGTSSYDLTMPNEAYFAHVDAIIRMAATNGIQVMLDPIDTAGLVQTALDNGVARCRAYGRYLGNRYKDFPNLVWLNGNDFQTWRIPANDAVFTAVAMGIGDNDTNHLQTVELDYSASSSLDDPAWAPLVGINLAYTYYPTYDEVLHAYGQSTNTPVFMGEEHYEFENVGGELGTPLVLRRQEYWTLLSGATGHLYGNGYTWPFLSGWQSHLDSIGVAQLQYATALFAPRAWYDLVPDTNHVLLVAGYGTYATGGQVSASDYATAARTGDGTLALAYVPTLRTVTVNLGALSGAVTAQWYDPENGTYQPVNGSPFPNTGTRNFTPPGPNSGGDPDWTLVLETSNDVTKPTLTITSPISGQRWSNGVFNVMGTTSNNIQMSSVMYQFNGAGWNPAMTADNWTNWTTQVILTQVTNTVQAYAVDIGGNFSTTNQVGFIYVPIVTVKTNGNGTISPNYNGASLVIGSNYMMTATAATGFSFVGWTGSSTTNGRTLKFVMAPNLMLTANFVDIAKPTLVITAPTAGQRWSNVLFTAKGTAGDNVQVANVYYSLNNGLWTNADTVNNWTNWTVALDLTPGTNHLSAYATDFTGNSSATNSVSLDFVVTNQLALSATGLGTVSPNYSNAWLELGRNYSMTAKPASGFIFSNWTSSLGWESNTASLNFMMQSNLMLTANFVDITKPTLTITAPTAGQHMTNAVAHVKGTSSDNWKVSDVWYQANGGVWNPATSANLWTNWTATIPLVAGTNMLKAYAVDLAGNMSKTNNISVVSSNAFKLDLNASSQSVTDNGWNFSLEVSPKLNGTIQVSTNLVDWLVLTNFVGSNATLDFLDTAATNFDQRFYRAVVQ